MHLLKKYSFLLLILSFGLNAQAQDTWKLLSPWSGVSRMKRVDDSFQCCIRDGSRSTA